MSCAIRVFAEQICNSHNIHVELALAAFCSLRKRCSLELAQQLIATDVSTGRDIFYDRSTARPVLKESFSPERAN